MTAVPALHEELAPAVAATAETRAAEIAGPRTWWAGPLDVEGLALGSVQAALSAAQLLFGPPARFFSDSASVRSAFNSLAHLRVDGRAPEQFAPLSGYFATSDGWVRLHANYPHHARALRTALQVTTKDEAVRRLAGLAADEVADRVTSAGGLAVALRTAQEWRDSPMGRAVREQPWIRFALAEGRTRALPEPGSLDGVRILDFTRVIAGPIATRLLALLGAEVLRVDPPDNPELADQYIDAGFGKRSAVADCADPRQLETVLALAASADAVVCGYRPGALRRFGLDAQSLRERFPDLVVVTLDAWGDEGPWGDRRGFDSLVQCATGIGERYGRTGAGGEWRPGALPCQALDHATGYGAAAAVLALLARRREAGPGWAHLSLARTAQLLLDLPPVEHAARELPVATGEFDSAHGKLRYAQPPVFTAAKRLQYRWPPGRYGADPLAWA
ncbi:L-carnitine dehydratase/bile acid-inducible protein F [Segniliparus rotundus DSM 44985]|uniref:L-carnitine dehydratase/bile acid-inducible protein F n=1 Tax=Segniliparus rotundus (strain ATCC BAA-972 / CDC 1076 / CIP 108378 / DSM 44985 / JCM 13578) TaxID=640132 RepID=D6Z857_SEGRD|nr:CoA transferase [Segniliparus rotundus]ADG98137.1 L-carnitine dehydratase/bile acid-inducible protein F [Segniliparus rotundus DSM 44985]